MPTIPRSLFTDLRSLPRPFWILLAGTFINRFGTFVWPFLTIYLTRNGYSLMAAGFAEYRPVSSNGSEAGRRLNRRIELVLLPRETPAP